MDVTDGGAWGSFHVPMDIGFGFPVDPKTRIAIWVTGASDGRHRATARVGNSYRFTGYSQVSSVTGQMTHF